MIARDSLKVTGVTLNLEIFETEFEYQWREHCVACEIKRSRRAAFYSTVNSTGRVDIGDVIINLIKSVRRSRCDSLRAQRLFANHQGNLGDSSQFLVSPEEISKCNRAFYRFSIIKAVQNAQTHGGTVAKTWQMMHIVCMSFDLRCVNDVSESYDLLSMYSPGVREKATAVTRRRRKDPLCTFVHDLFGVDQSLSM